MALEIFEIGNLERSYRGPAGLADEVKVRAVVEK